MNFKEPISGHLNFPKYFKKFKLEFVPSEFIVLKEHFGRLNSREYNNSTNESLKPPETSSSKSNVNIEENVIEDDQINLDEFILNETFDPLIKVFFLLDASHLQQLQIKFKNNYHAHIKPEGEYTLKISCDKNRTDSTKLKRFISAYVDINFKLVKIISLKEVRHLEYSKKNVFLNFLENNEIEIIGVSDDVDVFIEGLIKDKETTKSESFDSQLNNNMYQPKHLGDQQIRTWAPPLPPGIPAYPRYPIYNILTVRPCFNQYGLEIRPTNFNYVNNPMVQQAFIRNGQFSLNRHPLSHSQQKQHQMERDKQINQMNSDSSRVEKRLNIADQPPLTAETLASRNLQEQKQMLGERLYVLINSIRPECAGKITGMLLEKDNSELLQMLDSQDLLRENVEKAFNVLIALSSTS